MKYSQNSAHWLTGARWFGMCLSLLVFVPGVSGQAVDYRFETIGTTTAHAGSNAYFHLKPVFTSGTPATIYFDSVTANGSRIDFDVICRINSCPVDTLGRFWIYWGREPVTLRVTMPAALAPNTYTIAVATSVGATRKVTNLPLRVIAQATPLPAVSLPALPPLPGKAKWESTMTSLAAKWCPSPGTVFNFGDESQVWYYDGGRVFFSIAEYTGDPRWQACGLEVARQYKNFVNGANGALPAWRVFTKGLRMAYERTGDASYKDAVLRLTAKSSYANYVGCISDACIREFAYILNAYVEAERVGAPRDSRMLRAADILLGQYDMLFVAGKYSLHQVFFDGLAAEALINYYELTQDPRVPAAIKQMLDWVWDSGWNKSLLKLVVNPEPVGPKCSWGCQQYNTELINLTVPAFAWYYSVTGDSVYQARGDELFAHALDTDISYSGKIFSQNYYWSPSYVKWRSGGAAPASSACQYDVSPAATPQIPASGGTVSVSVSTGQVCSWTASSNAVWATAATPGGTGSKTVTFNVAANTAMTARSASLTVAGKTLALTQAATESCQYSVTPLRPETPAAGGLLVVTVTASAPYCTWNASTTGNSWIVVGNSSTRSGSGTVTYTVMPNTGVWRAAYVRVANVSVYASQLAGCTFTISQTSASVPASGGSVSVAVSPSASYCTWTASSAAWASTSSGVRTGPGSVTYSIPANTTAAARAVTVWIGGKGLMLTQAK